MPRVADQVLGCQVQVAGSKRRPRREELSSRGCQKLVKSACSCVGLSATGRGHSASVVCFKLFYGVLW